MALISMRLFRFLDRRLINREVNYLEELPYKKEFYYEYGKWIKSIFHFANGIIYEEVPNRKYDILYYNSERKNFYFKGNFLEKNDISLFQGTMHFKKDDSRIGDIKIKVKNEQKVKFVLDGVKFDKPSKVILHSLFYLLLQKGILFWLLKTQMLSLF